MVEVARCPERAGGLRMGHTPGGADRATRALTGRIPGGMRNPADPSGARRMLEVRQGDRLLARRSARLIPGRPVHLDAAWLAGVRPSDGPVLVALAHG